MAALSQSGVLATVIGMGYPVTGVLTTVTGMGYPVTVRCTDNIYRYGQHCHSQGCGQQQHVWATQSQSGVQTTITGMSDTVTVR